jgi:hypothetical protein
MSLFGEQVTAEQVLNDLQATENATAQTRNIQAAIYRESSAAANQARRNRETLQRMQQLASARSQSNYLRRVSDESQPDIKSEDGSRPQSPWSGPPTRQTTAATDRFPMARGSSASLGTVATDRFPMARGSSASVGNTMELRYFTPAQPQSLSTFGQQTQQLRTFIAPQQLPEPLTYPIPTTIYPTRYGPMTAPDYYVRPVRLTRKRRRSPGCCTSKRVRRPSYRKKLATKRRCRDKLGRFVRC